MVPGATNPEPPWHAQAREIFSAQMRRHCGLIDRIFAWLLIAQAVAAFAVASLLTLLAVVTLITKVMIERKTHGTP